MMSTASESEPRRRVWRRRILVVLTVLVLGVGLASWTLTRSWFLTARIEPHLARVLGGDVSVGSAIYRGGGLVRLDDVVLRAPRIDGPGGELFRAERIEVRIDPKAFLAGEVIFENVELWHVRARLAEDSTESGAFSFMELQPQLPESGRELQLPPVRVNMLTVENGRIDGDQYTPHGERSFSGSIHPIEGAADWYDIALVEVDWEGVIRTDGLVANGQWNVANATHTVRIEGVDLDDRMYDMCPQVAQLWWDRMELSGRVARVDVGWAPHEDFTFSFEVDDVGLTLPLATKAFWSRYQDGQIVDSRSRPRMQVREGTISIEQDRMLLSGLEGELISASTDDVVGVPYRVTVEIEDIPRLIWEDREAWMDAVLATVPFTMSFRTDDFRVRRQEGGDAPAVELPRSVAQVLERFRFSEWVLSTAVSVTRAAPNGGTPGAIRSAGQAYITEASGAYEGFPYLLENVSAFLEFDNDSVIVHELRGEGAKGVPVRLSGRVENPGPEASVELRLTAEGLPVDERLRDALRAERQTIFDDVMHGPSYAALRDAGLIDPEAFVLGGTVDLALDLVRPPRRGVKSRLEGTVRMHDVGILHRRFPYPLRVDAGTLHWTADGITLGDDVRVVSLGGATGTARGGVRMIDIDGVRRAVPELDITIESDGADDLLCAAIPPALGESDDVDPEGWPGATLTKGGRWLADLGVEGRMTYDVALAADDAGKIAHEVTVRLEDGRTQLSGLLTRVIGDPQRVPETWDRLTGCAAVLTVDRHGLELESFTGRLGDASVDVTARLAFVGGGITAAAHLTDITCGRELLDLLPPERREAVEAEWDRFDPRGTFDLDMTYRRDGDEATAFALTVHPRSVVVRALDEDVELTHAGGRLVYDGALVRFEGLALDVAGGAGGRVRLDGQMRDPGGGLPPASEWRAAWTGASYAAPLFRALLERVGGRGVREAFDRLEPQGRFGLLARASGGTFVVEAEPETLSLRRADGTHAFVFDDASSFYLSERSAIGGGMH